MKNPFRSLPIRLSLYICSILLAFLVAGMAFVCFFWSQRTAGVLEEHALTLTRQTANMLDRVFVQAQQSAMVLASTIEQCNSDRNEIQNIVSATLPAIHCQCPDVRGVAVAWCENMSKPGVKQSILISYEKNGSYSTKFHDDTFDYLYKDWFIIPITLGNPVWTIPYETGDGSGLMVLSYSVPFYRRDAAGKRILTGAIILDMSIDILAAHLKKSESTGLRLLSESCESFVLNQFGQFVIFPDHAAMLHETLFTVCDVVSNADPEDRNQAKRIFRSGCGRIELKRTALMAEPCDLYYSRCVNGWVVCAALPDDWITDHLVPVLVRIFLVWIVCVVAIVGIIFLICRNLNRPLLALSNAAEAVGRGDFHTPIPAIVVDDEIGRVTRSFGTMQTELASYIERLKETVAARERAEGELNAARRIQESILPHVLPPMLKYETVRASASLNAARGVGGDLYDIFPLDDNRLAVIIGDVSGKGIPAALFMAVTQSLQRTCATTSGTPGELATALNTMLCANNQETMFVTWWCAFLDVRDGTLVYSNAGHNPPLIKKRNGEIEKLDLRHGPPLAALDEFSFECVQTALADGDLLLLYTDGVTEAFNTENDMFGEDRLVELARRSSSQTPKALRDEVRDAVAAFTRGAPQSDDITILAVQYHTELDSICSIKLDAKVESLNDALAFVRSHPDFERLGRKKGNKLCVCVEEIFVNVAHYAFKTSGSTVQLECRTDFETNQLRVRIEDDGGPFNPLEAKEPDITLSAEERPIGGLGIFIVRKWMDYVNYDYRDGRNILTLGIAFED